MSFSPETENLVKDLIEVEYKNACTQFGEKYNSLHEGYAVLLEEMQEAETEINGIKRNIIFLWSNIKNNEEQNVEFYLDILQKYTQNSMKELAQVGAVLQKIKNTFGDVEDDRTKI